MNRNYILTPIDPDGFSVRNFNETAKRPRLNVYGKFLADLFWQGEKQAIIEKTRIDEGELTFMFTNREANEKFTAFAKNLDICAESNQREGLFHLLLTGYFLREMARGCIDLPRIAERDLVLYASFRIDGTRHLALFDADKFHPEFDAYSGWAVIIRSLNGEWGAGEEYYKVEKTENKA